MLNSYVHACGAWQWVEEAFDASSAGDAGIEPDERTIAALVSAAGLSRQLQRALDTVELGRSIGCPSIPTLTL